MNRRLFSSLAVLALIGWACQAEAALVPIVNPNFDDPTYTFPPSGTTDGGNGITVWSAGYTTGGIVGWTTTGQDTTDTGIWDIDNHPNSLWPTTTQAPSANQVAYIVSNDILSQVLTSTLQPNTVYTLTGWDASPLNTSVGNTITAEILAGTTVIGSNSAIVTQQGVFQQFSVTCDSTGFPSLATT